MLLKLVRDGLRLFSSYFWPEGDRNRRERKNTEKFPAAIGKLKRFYLLVYLFIYFEDQGHFYDFLREKQQIRPAVNLQLPGERISKRKLPDFCSGGARKEQAFRGRRKTPTSQGKLACVWPVSVKR